MQIIIHECIASITQPIPKARKVIAGHAIPLKIAEILLRSIENRITSISGSFSDSIFEVAEKHEICAALDSNLVNSLFLGFDHRVRNHWFQNIQNTSICADINFFHPDRKST